MILMSAPSPRRLCSYAVLSISPREQARLRIDSGFSAEEPLSDAGTVKQAEHLIHTHLSVLSYLATKYRRTAVEKVSLLKDRKAILKLSQVVKGQRNETLLSIKPTSVGAMTYLARLCLPTR